MNEAAALKEKMMFMAVSDMELLFTIIGELGFVGYRLSICMIKGHSLQQSVNKNGVNKGAAVRAWNKCRKLGYDKEIKRMYNL